MKRRICGLLVILWAVCILAGASGEALGKMLPGVMEAGSAFEATISGAVEKYPPFAEKRLEQLNRLLSHLSLHLEKDGEREWIEVLVDGEAALWKTLKAEDANRAFFVQEEEAEDQENQTDGESATAGEGDSVEPGKDRSLLWMLENGEAFLDQLYEALAGLPEAFPESFKEGKENITYREYGPVVKKRIGVITPEGEDGTGGLKAYLSRKPDPLGGILSDTPVLQGQQRTTLFLGEEGQILRLTYDGTIGRDADSLRKVSLNWRRLRTEKKELDNLTLKTPAVKGGDRNNLVMERRYEEREEDVRELTWTLSFDDVADRVRTTTEISITLKNQAGQITGELVHKEKTGNQLVRWYFRPELTLKNGTDYEGRLEIVQYSGKIELNHATLSLQLSTGSPSGRMAPEEIAGEESADQLAGRLLRALCRLPEEDLLFLTDGLTEEDLAVLLKD